MPGLFSRVKTWISGEVLTAADLNAEFDNVITNFEPDQMDDYSANVAEMQLTTDPGEVGSESLATSTAGELERLRFAVAEIKGTDEWYESPPIDLTNFVVSSGISANRITSSAVRAADDAQPLFITPAGSAPDATIKATTTNLELVINNQTVTFAADVALSSLSAAPSTNNTALVDDTDLAGGEETKVTGEGSSVLTIGTVGSEITSLVGDWATFKINNGVDDEYFMAYIKSGTELTYVYRGWFFDDSDAPVERITISDGDTITLMRTHWAFARNDGTTVVTSVKTPSISGDEPAGAVSGDYWLDLSEEKWKLHDGASFADDDSTFIGYIVLDDTNAVASRSYDTGNPFSDENSMVLRNESATEVLSTEQGGRVSVYGGVCKFEHQQVSWGMTTDLDSGVSENSSTTYYLYLKSDHAVVISDIKPQRRKDLRGLYHTHSAWRCVGDVFNDGSSDLEDPVSFGRRDRPFELEAAATGASGSYVTKATVEVGSPDGRPVMLGIQGKDGTDSYYFTETTGAGVGTTVRLRVLRDGVTLTTLKFFFADSANDARAELPATPLHVDLNPGSGPGSYELQIRLSNNDAGFVNCDFYGVVL